MKEPRVALVWRGSPSERRTATRDGGRLARVGAALTELGISVEPAVYCDEIADEVRDQLIAADGVLVWVNPMDPAGDRAPLNALLREVAAAGVMVSAHPDVIDAIGTKEVLFHTRHLGFGSDTRLYRTFDELRRELPACLAEGQARVLKPARGNGGNGVWKIELQGLDREAIDDHTPVNVRHAARGSLPEKMELGTFLERQTGAFSAGGALIDQVYEPRLVDGMVRCYLVGNRVAGFGEQLINALYPAADDAPPEAAPQPGPRLYYPPTRADLQDLKAMVEDIWLPELCTTVGLETGDLPVLWDADFLHGPNDSIGGASYVLCEINVSSVYPFPEEALQPLAHETLRRVTSPDR